MIKKIIKILLIISIILVLAILYLSIFGIKTDKFNNQIINNTLKINKKINLSLKDVKYQLNPSYVLISNHFETFIYDVYDKFEPTHANGGKLAINGFIGLLGKSHVQKNQQYFEIVLFGYHQYCQTL